LRTWIWPVFRFTSDSIPKPAGPHERVDDLGARGQTARNAPGTPEPTVANTRPLASTTTLNPRTAIGSSRVSNQCLDAVRLLHVPARERRSGLQGPGSFRRSCREVSSSRENPPPHRDRCFPRSFRCPHPPTSGRRQGELVMSKLGRLDFAPETGLRHRLLRGRPHPHLATGPVARPP
jgi:hypothetical protein